ncbi:hypothetical protein AeMF1_017880 [Aphanomyces euteiches]|nr:hypothetical protein AeMF1_017880 [Aphanomyces euteiches]KAH9165947.1 hypothetical protein AeNC1_018422 [Aphanomyces euteiches]
MRVLTPLVLVASAVLAFKQPRHDSSLMANHQQVRMDSAIQDRRILLSDASVASFNSPKRRLVANNFITSCFGSLCGKPGKKAAGESSSESSRHSEVAAHVGNTATSPVRNAKSKGSKNQPLGGSGRQPRSGSNGRVPFKDITNTVGRSNSRHI